MIHFFDEEQNAPPAQNSRVLHQDLIPPWKIVTWRSIRNQGVFLTAIWHEKVDLDLKLWSHASQQMASMAHLEITRMIHEKNEAFMQALIAKLPPELQ